MHNTRNLDAIASSLIELTGYLNSPKQDDVLLNAAGVSLDRALFPLLVRIEATRIISVVSLAEQSGKDASTVSRQLLKLEQLGLIERTSIPEDRRIKAATITDAGKAMIKTIAKTRRRLLGEIIEPWSDQDQIVFSLLLKQFTLMMKTKLLAALENSANKKG